MIWPRGGQVGDVVDVVQWWTVRWLIWSNGGQICEPFSRMIGAIDKGADAIRGAALLGRTSLPGDSKGEEV